MQFRLEKDTVEVQGFPVRSKVEMLMVFSSASKQEVDIQAGFVDSFSS